MAWRIAKVEEQRMQFIDAYGSCENSVADLCRDFDISRKTAYKWIGRFREEGKDGLKDRSKAPHTQAGQTGQHLEAKILEVKKSLNIGGQKNINQTEGRKAE